MTGQLQDRLNAQFNLEYYSSYLYLSMAAYCESVSLIGFAKWFKAQSAEELEHALKFFDYINSRQGRVILAKIDEPPADFSGVQDLFKRSLEHEQHVTASINAIYAGAVDERDFATQAFLNWFVTEQVEEESVVKLWLDKLQIIESSKGSLLYLDKEAGKRAKD